MINTILAALLFTCAVNDTTITLGDVTVNGQRSRDFQMQTSQTVLQVNRDFLSQNFAGSLMQTLEGIPGVKAMSIGSGQSKPTIRGLGFNRLAVSEDGIKHEGQQWGDDHGLEIDQFAIDRAEIIKGPAALLYGTDAIGGVLSIYTKHLPTKPFEGAVQLFGRSNNEQMGLSAKMGGRNGRFFYRANITLIDYADYSVTTDSIQYYSYWIRLKDRRLRNTAGTERDGSITAGYAGYRFHTDIRVSDNFSKSGFFANAHGLEVRLSDIDHDRSRRDIDLPYQQVNHLKVISHTSWNSDALTADLSLAYQNNLRKETSEPLSHGYMPQPEGPLERQFNKSTYTANGWLRLTADRHTLQGGLNAEMQHNRRDGWGFIIPDFESAAAGIYLTDRYALSDGLILNGGVRLDHARTHIHDYYDWYETPVDGIPTFKQRATDMRKSMNSLTWAAGVNYATGNWMMKANVGKSFRMPIPKELGTNGINYHIFRYEQGNPQLDPEESYQMDASIGWANDRVEMQVDPFVNYFPNYIYLNPTARFVEGLQLYHYTQARVIRYGAEAQFTCNLTQHWQLLLQGEYLYARQRSGEKKGYSLPFSTPWSVDAAVKYAFDLHGKGFLKLNAHIVGRQDEIVPPEQPTGGFYTLNFSAGKYFRLKTAMLNIALHADNLLNRRYYDHTSYYRLIDVPEPGRNLSLKVGLEF